MKGWWRSNLPPSLKVMTIYTYKEYLQKYKDCQSIIQLWNDEYQMIYPISVELFQRNISNICEEASYIVVSNQIVVGFIFSKIWDDEYQIESYKDAGWISLFCIKKNFRNQGIGSKLLDLVEQKMLEFGKKVLFLGKDYNNYFPGLPVDLKNGLGFFLKRGFERPYDTYDLMNVNKDYIPLRGNKYQFRFGTMKDKDDILSFIHSNWPGRWHKEAIDYFKNGGTGKEYLLCLDNEKVIGFAKVNFPDTEMLLISNNLTWRNRFKALGGIGPLGIDKDYRKQNLGFDIVAYAINSLNKVNATNIIIDWTGLLDFYRLLGFEVWKSYFYLNKKLKGDNNA